MHFTTFDHLMYANVLNSSGKYVADDVDNLKSRRLKYLRMQRRTLHNDISILRVDRTEHLGWVLTECIIIYLKYNFKNIRIKHCRMQY